VPTENLRFRQDALVFKVAESATEEEAKRLARYEYPTMRKTMGSFKLDIEMGQFTDSEILVMLGENGTGKTTFIRMLAGKLQPDEGSCEFNLLKKMLTKLKVFFLMILMT
jgi:ATP-binding cassette subfamily E protein 1